MTRIEAPGTIETGDIMMVGDHYYIGLSTRTSQDGANQMIKLLRGNGLNGITCENQKAVRHRFCLFLPD